MTYIKYIAGLIALIALIDFIAFIAWIISGQVPVDGFYIGAITGNALKLIIL